MNRTVRAAFPGNPNLRLVVEIPHADRQGELFTSMGLGKIGPHIPGSKTAGHTREDQEQIEALDDMEADLEQQLKAARRSGDIKMQRELLHRYEKLLIKAGDYVRKEQDNKRKIPAADDTTQKVKRPSVTPDVGELVRHARDITRRGLAPLFTFVGMVNVKMGGGDIRRHYKWVEGTHNGGGFEERTDVVNGSGKTVADFLRLNRHLGGAFLDLLMEMYHQARTIESLVGDCLAIDDAHDLNQAAVVAIVGPDEYRYAPAWVWGVLGDSTFRTILEHSTFSAFEIALAQVRRVPGAGSFTLKELICSEGVRDQFAFLVASGFLFASGGNAYPASTGAGGMRYNISAGFRTRLALSNSIVTAHVWFESVYKTQNTVYAGFNELYVTQRDSAVTEEDFARVGLMERLLGHMARWKLVHVE